MKNLTKELLRFYTLRTDNVSLLNEMVLEWERPVLWFTISRIVLVFNQNVRKFCFSIWLFPPCKHLNKQNRGLTFVIVFVRFVCFWNIFQVYQNIGTAEIVSYKIIKRPSFTLSHSLIDFCVTKRFFNKTLTSFDHTKINLVGV